MESSLNEIITVTSLKGCKRTITGVVTKNPSYHHYTINYPIYNSKGEVFCGSISFSCDKVKSIRPATEEEIKAWRKAEGVAKAARAKANTVEKVKDIKWIRVALTDSTIISTL